jgi:hypothetical protein
MSPLVRVGSLSHSGLVSYIPIIDVILVLPTILPLLSITSTTACKECEQCSDQQRDGGGKNEPCGITVRSRRAGDVGVDGISDDTEDSKVQHHADQGNEESEEDD